MIETNVGAKYSGKFVVDGKQIDGELTFDGRDTALHLHHAEFFCPVVGPDPSLILGTLREQTKVSLIKCIGGPIPGETTTSAGQKYYNADVSPHFVVYGRDHLDPDAKMIQSIHCSVSDASSLFYDFDAFVHPIAPTPEQLAPLIEAYEERVGRKISLGTYPQVSIYTGKDVICSATTKIGKISASHNIGFSIGGPAPKFSNKITVNIEFLEGQTFDGAIDALLVLLRFLELIAGRRQSILALRLLVNSEEKHPLPLEVFWCGPPSRRGESSTRSPHPSDLPIDAVREPEAFAKILPDWIERDKTWRAARIQFSDAFSQENSFSPTRIISAANMFDLLPENAVPGDVPIPPDLLEACSNAKAAFKKLPDSPERNSVLGALGRVGKSSLRRKIRHRAAPVLEVFGAKLPHWEKVLDLAVDCRNFFVHGGEAATDYGVNFFSTVPFLTETLEFAFGASDLLEAGWDIKTWLAKGTTMSHPWGAYRVNYAENLAQLNSVLPVKKQIGV